MGRNLACGCLLAVFASACGDDAPAGGDGGGADGAAPGTELVAIRFAGKVGSEAFACGQTYAGLGTGSTAFTGHDFRLYVQDVKLLAAGGAEVPVTLTQDGKWQLDNVALLDFENGSGCDEGNADTNVSIRGTVPAGDYTGVRFTVGVPFELNHGNAARAASPLNLTSMFWTWNSGYKFLRIDGTTPNVSGFRMHVGSTGCDGDAMGNVTRCTEPNRATVTLQGVDLVSDVIVADIAKLFEGADLGTNTPETPPGCMSGTSDPDCRVFFHNLGLAWDGEVSPGQKFFRVDS